MFERCLYFNVNALARTVNRIWGDAFRELNLSPAHGYLLRAVLNNPGTTQKVIASELRLEKSTVTRFIDALQDKGLLKRSRQGVDDNRELKIFPTEKAKKMRDKLESTGDSLYKKMQRELGDTELKSLVMQLREVSKTLE